MEAAVVKTTKVDEKGRSVTVMVPLPHDAAGGARLERFLSIEEVERATGFDRKLIYKWIGLHRFPRQVTVKAVPDAKRYQSFWLEREIVDWQQAQIGERDRAVATGEPMPKPSRLSPQARAQAQATFQKNRNPAAPCQGTTAKAHSRPMKRSHYAETDEAAPA
jgi:predicted DNA-binding transcriptional regulator AlpA